VTRCPADPGFKKGPGAAKSLSFLPLCVLLLHTATAQAAHEIAISQEQMQRIGINLVSVEAA